MLIICLFVLRISDDPRTGSHNAFIQKLIPDPDFTHTRNFALIKAEAEHVPRLQTEPIQITHDLLFAFLVPALAVSDFHLDDIPFSAVMNDHIRSFPVPGLLLNAESSNAVDNGRQIGQELLPAFFLQES